MSVDKIEYTVEDIEKQKKSGEGKDGKDGIFEVDKTEGAVKETEYTVLPILNKLAAKLSAETKGIERVTDEEKTDTSILNAASMWFSANMVIAAFALGALGPAVFGLNFWMSVIATVLFTFIGLFPVAYFSIFGVEFGLRQMVLSRFLMGNVTARIFCLINVVACIGWGAVNTIAAASLLHMVNPDGARCPPWVACFIITILTVIVTFFGYKVIHAYEKWSWVPNFVVFLIIIARLKISGNFTAGDWDHKSVDAGAFLSFGGVIFGSASGWATYAADYTVYMPSNTNRYKIFFSLVAGLSFPLCFTCILGAAAAMCIRSDPVWNRYYNDYSIGGLCYAILVENSLSRFGEFCCVVLAMSTVANNIPNMYSIALSTQALWAPLARIPRVAWTLLGNLLTLAIAIPAYYKFESFMTIFMDAIAYYLAIYIAISLTEHFVFRRSFQAYNAKDWNRWDKLPIGYASFVALFVGAIGVALGMSSEYWQGQISRALFDLFGDIGFEVAAIFTFIVYIILRPLEIKYTGR
ncbi:cytosine permease Ecym_4335 [Eremothecium cymbalariae DBVPG|uniref:Purine-cytosine permease n=1 Tax=Eremothecium cymbalariae (strain CBS 270.75 / DBVPG 7215 / KCTC 17166 / NRRL Y-17582) TaxID=931890 RepID=G8JTP4_ERECY|nr:hypothetical protein Ecym_4335 [Eremothecium cymbalariae DBVPG\